MRYLKVLVISLFLVLVLLVPTEGLVAGVLTPLEVLEQRVAVLEAKLANVSVEDVEINGLKGPHFIFEGVNVHIRSDSGLTTDTGAGSLTGLGNLVVGYTMKSRF